MRGLRRAGRWLVATLGRPWVFWPSLLFLGILRHGPDGFGSTWAWVAALLASGPGLALAIRLALVSSADRRRWVLPPSRGPGR